MEKSAMVPTDRSRFAACLLAASELYGKPVGEAVVAVWWDALARFDIGAVESAFRRHFANPDTGQFMPKPADIVRLIEGTTVDVAQVAWSKVDRAIRTVGPYASVTFDDPIVMRVLQDMGGWIALAQRTEDEWPFVANEFRTRFAGYRSRALPVEHLRRLPGIAEMENASRGIEYADVVLIGDPAAARAVADGGIERPAIGVQRVSEAANVPRLSIVKGAKP